MNKDEFLQLQASCSACLMDKNVSNTSCLAAFIIEKFKKKKEKKEEKKKSVFLLQCSSNEMRVFTFVQFMFLGQIKKG